MSTVKRLAAFACAGLIVSSLAGCGSSGKPGAAASDAAVTMGSVRAFQNLDPAWAYDNGSWTVFSNIYQSLMSYQPGATTPTPDAAKSCSFTDATLTAYSCTLRSGLAFSNGDPLDAQAVQYSFERALRLNPQNGKGFGPGPLLWNIDSVSASGDTGIIFHLKKPDATFPGEIASPAGAIVDPKVFPADQPYTGTSPVGSGVYRVASASERTVGGSKQGASIKLFRNPAYHGSASTPQNGSFTFKYFDTPEQLEQAVAAGRIDIASNDLLPSDVVKLQDAQQVGKGVQVQTGSSSQIRLLMFDLKVKPFDDPAVRRAAAQLVDQKAIAAGPERGLVDPLYSLVPSGVGGHTTPFLDTYQGPSVSAARSLLSSAGVSTPVRFTLTYSQDAAGSAEEAALLKQQLEKGGLFKVGLNSVHDIGQLETGFKADRFGAFTGYWFADYPDAADNITPLFGSYHDHYTSSSVDTELAAASRDADRTVANAPFARIQQQIADDAAMVPLWQNKQYTAVQSDITGVPLTLDVDNIFRAWLVGKGGAPASG